MKNILISGYFGFDNSGDDAILKAIVSDLKKCKEDISITVLSKNPKKTKWQYGVSAVDRFNLREVMKTMKRTDLLISGGGSLLQDITSTRSIIYYLGIINIARFYKVKTYVFANGVGPIDKKLNRYLTAKTLKKVDYITLRDRLSEEFLRELGLKKKMEVTSDPVFSLETAQEAVVDEIKRIERLNLDNCIAFAVRRWKDDAFFENLLGAIDELSSEGYNILLMPMHFPEDLKFSKELLEASKNPDRISIIEHSYKAEELMGIMKRLRLMVAMRLHSLIYAANANLPSVGIIYDPKVRGLLEDLKNDRSVEMDFTKDELLNQIRHAIKEEESIRTLLSSNVSEMKIKTGRNIDIAMDLIRDL